MDYYLQNSVCASNKEDTKMHLNFQTALLEFSVMEETDR